MHVTFSLHLSSVEEDYIRKRWVSTYLLDKQKVLEDILTKGVRQNELTFGFICGGDQEELSNSRGGESDDRFTIIELKKNFCVIPLLRCELLKELIFVMSSNKEHKSKFSRVDIAVE